MEINAETSLSTRQMLGADRRLPRPEVSHQRRRVGRTSRAWKLREVFSENRARRNPRHRHRHVMSSRLSGPRGLSEAAGAE